MSVPLTPTLSPQTRGEGAILRPLFVTGHRSPFTVMYRPAVHGRLFPLGHAVVADHARDAEPIVGENAGPALRLRKAMPLELAPAFDRLLIAPDRKRQRLALVCETFEPLDRDEPVKLLELRPELFGQIEILHLPPRGG